MAKQRVKAQLVRCYECEHSHLFQFKQNPIIAVCSQRKSFGEAYRMVAKAEHQCELYDKFKGMVKPIEHR